MCKEGRIEKASIMLGKMKENDRTPSAVTYNALIDGYCNKGDLEGFLIIGMEWLNKK